MSPRNVGGNLLTLGCGTGYVECDLGSVVSDVQSVFCVVMFPSYVCGVQG